MEGTEVVLALRAEAPGGEMRRLTWLLLFWSLGPAWAGDGNIVKFRLHNHFLILVSGSVGPLKELTFVVDTGASRSILDARTAHRLRLPSQRDEVFICGRGQTTGRVELPEFNFGPVHMAKFAMLVMDLTSIARALGTDVDAVIGLDVLRRRSFVIDYRHRLLEFGAVEPRGAAAAFEPSPYLVITAQVDGEPVRLLVDTGADQLSLFLERLPEKLRRRPRWAASGASAAGGVEGGLVREADVRFGDSRLPDAVVYVVAGNAEFHAYDGHLGVSVLGATRVHFDFDHGQLHWEK